LFVNPFLCSDVMDSGIRPIFFRRPSYRPPSEKRPGPLKPDRFFADGCSFPSTYRMALFFPNYGPPPLNSSAFSFLPRCHRCYGSPICATFFFFVAFLFFSEDVPGEECPLFFYKRLYCSRFFRVMSSRLAATSNFLVRI